MSDTNLPINTAPTVQPQVVILSDGKSKDIWSKSVNKFNIITLIGAVALIFTLDLFVAFLSYESISFEEGLWSFWWEMIAVLVGLIAVAFIEYLVSLKFRATTPQSLDKSIYAIVIIRNIVVFLNFIPLIQLIGIVAIYTIVPFLLLMEAALLVVRAVKK